MFILKNIFMKVLVINSGSSSIKYQLIDTKNQTSEIKGIVEKIGLLGASHSYTINNEKVVEDVLARDHREALSKVISIVTSMGLEIEAIGHRVVHGGHKFFESVIIDNEVIEYIREFSKLAPLHNPPNLLGILACKEILPNLKQVAVFDTAFHQTIPEENYIYGIPYRYYEKHRIRKYGFHGTSHKYVAYKTCEILKIDIEKINIITCHLGNGASITAIKNGKSFDTSMGMTPLEGLLMGTRCGDIDPGIILFLMDKENISTSEMDKLLNKESGILGISGISSDMRIIEEEYIRGNSKATLAFKVFCNRIKKYIGAYAFEMGKVDLIIFTGGIGENSPIARELILSGLENFGIKIDPKENEKAFKGKFGIISTNDSKVIVTVTPTNEELAIALETERLLTSSDNQ